MHTDAHIFIYLFLCTQSNTADIQVWNLAHSSPKAVAFLVDSILDLGGGAETFEKKEAGAIRDALLW